ncbi:hypothetical protein Tco_0812336, partial [Tanacetum coccineum]
LCEYVEVVGFESLVLRAGSAKKVLNHAQFRQQFDFDAKNTRNKMEMEYIAKGWNAMKARMAVQHEITSFANEAIMGWLSSIYDDYFAVKECLKEHGGDLIMTGLSVIFMWLGSFLNIDGSLEQVFYFEDMSSVLWLNYCHSSLVLSLVYIAKVVSSMVGAYGSYKVEWVVYFLRYDKRPNERISLDDWIKEQSGMDSSILED